METLFCPGAVPRVINSIRYRLVRAFNILRTWLESFFLHMPTLCLVVGMFVVCWSLNSIDRPVDVSFDLGSLVFFAVNVEGLPERWRMVRSILGGLFIWISLNALYDISPVLNRRV
jgi:hypothetical protein